MRYRRLDRRYTMVVRSTSAWSFEEVWQSERPRLLPHARWRPDADTYETPVAIEIIVDLAGVDEDDFEVQLFEDALIVEGIRQLPACREDAVYHAAVIRHGPFRLEMLLPAPVAAERVEVRYDRGILRITLPKHAERG